MDLNKEVKNLKEKGLSNEEIYSQTKEKATPLEIKDALSKTEIKPAGPFKDSSIPSQEIPQHQQPSKTSPKDSNISAQATQQTESPSIPLPEQSIPKEAGLVQ